MNGNKAPKRKNDLMAAGAALATAAMLYWSTGLRPVWWLVWLAPLPVLLVGTKLGRARCFSYAAFAWFLGSLNLWHYLIVSIGVPLSITLLASAVPACFFGLPVLLFREFVRRGILWRAVLAFPASWVTYEFLYALSSPHSTFGNLGYTQMDCLPVLQITSLVGIWGISFCVFLLSATMAALLSPIQNPKEKMKFAIPVCLGLVAVFGYGARRLMPSISGGVKVTIGLAATGVDTTFPHEDGAAVELLGLYSNKGAELAAQGAQIIVLPEKIALVSDQTTPRIDSLYRTCSLQARADVVVGLDRGTVTKRYNEARLYSSDGELAAVYVKHHLVPGFEDADRPGTEITTVKKPSGVWGMQICKDMDFPALSRRYGNKGVGLLLVPAWDFTLDAWLHSRMAIMRGVENGFSIARAAKQGLLTVSDSRGRILAQRDAASVRFASLVADAPVRYEHTFYSRWGDWFAWLNVCICLLLLFTLSLNRGARR